MYVVLENGWFALCGAQFKKSYKVCTATYYTCVKKPLVNTFKSDVFPVISGKKTRFCHKDLTKEHDKGIELTASAVPTHYHFALYLKRSNSALLHNASAMVGRTGLRPNVVLEELPHSGIISGNL